MFPSLSPGQPAPHVHRRHGVRAPAGPWPGRPSPTALKRPVVCVVVERKARAPIALALEELQPGDLPFYRAVALGQGEPRGDRGEVLPQPGGDANHHLNHIAVPGAMPPTPC